jgi:hypothetical protein
MVLYAPRPAGEPNPWDEATWNLTGQGNFIRQHGEKRAAQRASEAGTSIGAPRKRPIRPVYITVIQKRFIGATGAITAGGPVVLGFGQSGVMLGAQQYTLAIAATAAAFPGVSPSEAYCDVAPTGDVALQLVDAALDVLATITYLAGSHTGTVAWTLPSVSIAAGDVLSVVGPPVADATFAGANIAFVGKAVS